MAKAAQKRRGWRMLVCGLHPVTGDRLWIWWWRKTQHVMLHIIYHIRNFFCLPRPRALFNVSRYHTRKNYCWVREEAAYDVSHYHTRPWMLYGFWCPHLRARSLLHVFMMWTMTKLFPFLRRYKKKLLWNWKPKNPAQSGWKPFSDLRFPVCPGCYNFMDDYSHHWQVDMFLGWLKSSVAVKVLSHFNSY